VADPEQPLNIHSASTAAHRPGRPLREDSLDT
jgi:hypothetical protein